MGFSNPRAGTLPECVVVMSIASGTLPTNYAHECAYYSKFLKQVPDGCTNPGCTAGGATHCHGNSGSHAHCVPGCNPHSHGGSTNGVGKSGSHDQGGPFGQPSAPGCFSPSHSHPVSVGSCNAPITIPACTGAHTHPSGCNGIRNYTVRYLKHSASVINMRQTALPADITLGWYKSLSTIPDGFTLNATLVNEYIQGVASACATPLCLTNPGAHSHSAVAHNHCVTVGAHSHTVTVNPGGSASGSDWQGTPGIPLTAVHSHPSSNTGCNAGTTPVASSPHAHCGSTLELSRGETAYITNDMLCMRKKNIPLNTVAVWGGTLASIPNCYIIQDGNCCTVNMFGRYMKGVPTACTNPGSTTGSNTHDHSASESLSASVPHSHPHPGSTGSATPTTGVLKAPSPWPNSAFLQGPHSHSNPIGSSSTPICTPAAPHPHTSVSHEPSAIEVAFIERV